jgi:hypothetical protein
MAERRTDLGHLGTNPHVLEDVCRYDTVGDYNAWWQMQQKAKAIDELMLRKRAADPFADSVELQTPDDDYRSRLLWIGESLLSPTDFADMRTRCTPTGATIAATAARIRQNLDDLTQGIVQAPQTGFAPPPPSLVASTKDASAFAQTREREETMNGDYMPAPVNGGLKGLTAEITSASMPMKGLLLAGLLGLGYTIADLAMWKRSGKKSKKRR